MRGGTSWDSLEGGRGTRSQNLLDSRHQDFGHSLASLDSQEPPPRAFKAETAKPHWLISTHLDFPVTHLPLSNWDPTGTLGVDLEYT